MNTFRIAIIGAGPKGMSALERLLTHAHGGTTAARFDVDVYEPHPHPGAGPVYDPRQPAYLRMNVASSIIDAWWVPDGRVPDDDLHPSFATWSHEFGDVSPFPPRALVGEYLSQAFERIVADAPPGVSVRVLAERASSIERDPDGWRVGENVYDEVLVATGHAADWARSLPFSQGVFPVDRELTVECVKPGAIVAARGFALTFIDAALALTEGRGGSFHPVDGHPWRLRYEPGAEQVASIRPYTRSGQPMLAKPTPGLLDAVPGMEVLIADGQRRVRELDDATLVDDLESIIDEVAGAVGRLIAAHRGEPLAEPPTPDSVLAQITASLDASCGAAQPSDEWARGHTWRVLYPAIVDRMEQADHNSFEWAAFANLAAELERLAFGPPPINAAKLVALVDAGIVQLDYLRDETAAIWGADVTVDAVLPGPGVRELELPVLEHVLASGHVSTRRGRRGLDVLPDGTCLTATGEPAPGLAAIGRPTEDTILGNDTLSRALHPLADRWAARVVAAAAQADSLPLTAGAPA